jgi:acyl-CoA thioesterase-1
MIRIARGARAEPVLVGIMIPPNYGIDYAAQFRDLYAAVAKKLGVTLVPFLLDGIAEKPSSSWPTRCIPRPRRSRASSTTCGRRSSRC